MKKKVGERIRIARVTKGLSQQNIADELGLTVASYSNIERGVTDITITRLFEIATILNVKIEHLLGLTFPVGEIHEAPSPYLKKEEITLSEMLLMIEELQKEIKEVKESTSSGKGNIQ